MPQNDERSEGRTSPTTVEVALTTHSPVASSFIIIVAVAGHFTKVSSKDALVVEVLVSMAMHVPVVTANVGNFVLIRLELLALCFFHRRFSKLFGEMVQASAVDTPRGIVFIVARQLGSVV